MRGGAGGSHQDTNPGGARMTPFTVGLIAIALLIVLLFSGMPVGIVMGVVGFAGLTYLRGLDAGLFLLGSSPFETAYMQSLAAIVLFVLMGALCAAGGISADLYNAAHKWLGHLPGGLAMTTIAACAGFGAVTGSSVAGSATMGAVALPEMRRYKYDPGLATGSVAVGGTLGILIPPSLAFIIYAIITEQSISKLFIAGILPGVLLSILFIITIYIRCSLNPELAPAGAPFTSLSQRLKSIKSIWPVAALFLLVIGGLYVGVFSASEGGAMGAFGAIVIGLVQRRLSRKSFLSAIFETTRISAFIVLIIIGATIFGYFMAVSTVPLKVARFAAELPVSRYVVLAAILLVYMFLGCIMEAFSMLFLTLPTFYPVIVVLGFDPIWFGVIMVVTMEMAMITPPVGLNVYVVSGIAKDVPPETVFAGVWPFCIAIVVFLVLVICFPQIALFLPNLLS